VNTTPRSYSRKIRIDDQMKVRPKKAMTTAAISDGMAVLLSQ